jgi:ribonuclease E
MPQLDVPSSQHEDAEEKDATEHEFHESLNNEQSPVETKPAGGRKRRRAASSGIITA